jgi:vacuolar-type H+-ATPase subunit E/Vma4
LNVDEKIKQFSDVVIREATLHRDETLKAAAEEFERRRDEYARTAKRKYDRWLEEERARITREQRRRVVAARSDMKRALIAKRNEQVEAVFADALELIRRFTGTDEYADKLVEHIRAARPEGYAAAAYLASGDMRHKARIERETGVKAERSDEDLIGGFKIRVSASRVIDRSFRTALEERKIGFNRIKI